MSRQCNLTNDILIIWTIFSYEISSSFSTNLLGIKKIQESSFSKQDKTKHKHTDGKSKSFNYPINIVKRFFHLNQIKKWNAFLAWFVLEKGTLVLDSTQIRSTNQAKSNFARFRRRGLIHIWIWKVDILGIWIYYLCNSTKNGKGYSTLWP